MIKKIELKIFLIIFILLSIMVGVAIVYNTYSSYKSSIKSVSLYLEKIYEESKDSDEEISGFYKFRVKNKKVMYGNSDDSVLIEYAKNIYSSDMDSGIIGDYIFRNKTKGKDKKGDVILLYESKDEIADANNIIFIGIASFGICAIIIFIVAKKISKIIVKPIKETFDKQSQFVSDASHELKTPLAVIRANVDVIEKETGSSKWITYIQNEIDSMSKLISEMLLLSKIENIGKVKEVEKCNISEEIELICSAFESLAYENKIKYETKITENIVSNIEKEDIKHIVSTLIDNAIKHTKSEDNIKVLFDKEKDIIKLEVMNQGIEIPKEERKKIFERFYRIDKARNREEKRYGLGLAIAKATVEKYNGNIEIDYKDGYTIFRVIFKKK